MANFKSVVFKHVQLWSLTFSNTVLCREFSVCIMLGKKQSDMRIKSYVHDDDDDLTADAHTSVMKHGVECSLRVHIAFGSWWRLVC